LPVVMPAEELVDLLLGQVPRLPDAEATLALDPQAGYRLTLTSGAVTQRLLVHPKYHRVISSEVVGMRTYAAHFDDFDDQGRWVLPKTLVLDAPTASTRLELHYKDVTVNENPDLTFFQLDRPPTATLVEVDERGRPVAP